MADFLITPVTGVCSLTQAHDVIPKQETCVMSDLWDLLLRLGALIIFFLSFFFLIIVILRSFLE